MTEPLLALALALAGPAAAAPPEVVPSVDLARFAGKWYEIASIPSWFTRSCQATTATYTLAPGDLIQVLNECRKGSLDGEYSSIEGKAWVTDPATNAKWQLSFFWPMRVDYWIFGVAPDYSWSVVGGSDRGSLWVMSRTPRMEEALYATILAGLEARGWDVAELVRTPQP